MMSKLLFSVTALGMLLCAGWLSPALGDQPPNIVLILSDDQSWFDASCYGSENVQTPNIDRLAEQGMRFDAMFTATAMCAPTRQQFLTGLFPVRSGAYPNHGHVREGTRSLVHHLRSMGYRVGMTGKRHIGPRASFPFDDINGINGFKSFIEADKDTPFCAYFAFTEPHHPWRAGDASKFDADSLVLPPDWADTPQTRHAYAKYLAEIRELDRKVGRLMAIIDEAGLADDTVFIWSSEQGSSFPGAKWTCYDAGQKTAFIARWPGKVEPGSTTDALTQYVDVVPTLIEIAGGTPNEFNTGRPGALGDNEYGFDGRSLLDVLLGEADTHHEYVFGAHTTRGIIHGTHNYPIRSVRDDRFKLIRNLNHKATFVNIVTQQPARMHHVWTSWVEAAEHDEHAAAMVFRYQHRPEIEFYDIREDPFELNNLAGDDRYKEEISRLDAQLTAWMEQQGDEGKATEALVPASSQN